MFEVDKQWIERVQQCLYKATVMENELILNKLKYLEFKFFNFDLEDEDYEKFDLIEEELKMI